MLLILFKINDHFFGIDADQIVSIVPCIDLKPIAGVPNFVAGLFDFRGSLVPVIDVKMLTVNSPCQRHLSTRITLIRYETRFYEKFIIGIMAENMTDIIEVDEKDLKEIPLNTNQQFELGKIVENEGRIIQCVEFHKMISEELEKELFRDNKQPTLPT